MKLTGALRAVTKVPPCAATVQYLLVLLLLLLLLLLLDSDKDDDRDCSGNEDDCTGVNVDLVVVVFVAWVVVADDVFPVSGAVVAAVCKKPGMRVDDDDDMG